MNFSDDKTYQQTFFSVPSRIITLPGITVPLLRFYETIFGFWHNRKPCYLSNSAIKERTGIKSISTIISCFSFFEQSGEMERVYKNGKRYIKQPILAVETDPEDSDDDDHKDDNKSKENAPGGIAVPIGGYRRADRGGIAVPIHNNNNINTKNTNTTTTNKVDCSSEFFLISKVIDAELLLLKNQYLKNDERNDEEFLKQCKFHLENGDKTKYTYTARLNGLKKIISRGVFETPCAYKPTKPQEPIKSQEDALLIERFKGAIQVSKNMKRMETASESQKDFFTYFKDKSLVKRVLELAPHLKKDFDSCLLRA